MRLKNILKGIDVNKIYNFKNYDIKSITHISTDVIKGSLFICIEGDKYNGNDFVSEAILKGAKCIITEKDLEITGVTTIVVKNIRIVMSLIAKNFYNNVCDSLNIVGVVGTSGKTTTTHILYQMLRQIDNNIGLIGTNGIYIGDMKLDNKFTTPDPLELHYVFYQMKMLGVKTVIMEVSAQAIYYHKLAGVKLKVGVFTNISKEHLDFFSSMEDYVRCKMNYFVKDNMTECVVNVDDFYGRELAFKVGIPCVSYGIEEPANSFAVDIESSIGGLKFTANVMDTIISVNNKMIGRYNVYNILAAMTVMKLLGFEKYLQESINCIDQIDGRFNIFDCGGKKIIVDFAHTPESIDNLLDNVKSMVCGRIISLFGCVGYSNKEKRIDMASAVDKYSDFIVVTTDNRGSVSFKDISEDIVEGIKKNKYVCIEDRRCAINFGFGMLKEGDCLVLIGKGAENFQMIDDERCEYNEIQYVKELISGE